MQFGEKIVQINQIIHIDLHRSSSIGWSLYRAYTNAFHLEGAAGVCDPLAEGRERPGEGIHQDY
jgi:hypothetical protein